MRALRALKPAAQQTPACAGVTEIQEKTPRQKAGAYRFACIIKLQDN